MPEFHESRSPANMANIRHSRPDPGLGVQVEGMNTVEGVPFWRGRGRDWFLVRLPGKRET